MSRVATIGDGEYDYEYTWSIFGNLTSVTQDLEGLSDDVVFSYAYDVLGQKTSVSAAIGTTEDYVNTYSYDNLGRLTQITQSGATGGNAVAEKRVDYSYNDDATRATITRYADLAGTTGVAETEKVYDLLGRVTDIVHEQAGTEFADYDLTWNAANQLTDFDFESLVGDYGETSYTYDDTGQLTGADYASDWQDDESYTYDSTGNRTLVDGTTTYTTGDHNRLTSDGTYNYTYDGEGNVLTKTNISTGESVEYTWDHRNRLTKVTYKDASGTATKIIEYAYNFGQQWVRKILDSDADGTADESTVFVHNGGQIVLQFESTGTADAGNSDLAHRYLWSNSVDDLLADETVDDGTADDVAWALTDHLGSVRDLVVYDPTTETVSVANHIVYDVFGNTTGSGSLFLYTARPFDADTELQNNRNRWYDATTGRWLSTDPIGFAAGDVNLYRYVGNSPGMYVDPWGLHPFAGLEDALKGILGNNPSATEIKEAEDIALAITRTWDLNGCPRWLWNTLTIFHRLVHVVSARRLGGCEKNAGKYCCEWAYGFEDACKICKPTSFTWKHEYCHVKLKENVDPLEHHWVRITSNRTGKSVYVDDGFHNGDYVHTKRPQPYSVFPPTYPGTRRTECNPVRGVGPEKVRSFDERVKEFQRITGESIFGNGPRW